MCGCTDDLTDEHVISKTVRKQLPLVTGVRRIFQGRTSGQRQVLHVVLEKAVCQTCNNGWMRDLENDFVALLGPQLRNERAARLNPDAQERVATWAIKTALLLQLYSIALDGKNAYAPQDNLTWLVDHVSPPPGSEVWFGRHNARNRQLHWSRPGAMYWHDTTPISYVNTFSVGYVVFYVLGNDVQIIAGRPRLSVASLKPPPRFSQVVVQIWPGNGDDAVWPSRESLEFDELDTFTNWPVVRLGEPLTQPNEVDPHAGH
jgi:hypothetical protein